MQMHETLFLFLASRCLVRFENTKRDTLTNVRLRHRRLGDELNGEQWKKSSKKARAEMKL
jgi:hypothetical protein